MLMDLAWSFGNQDVHGPVMASVVSEMLMVVAWPFVAKILTDTA